MKPEDSNLTNKFNEDTPHRRKKYELTMLYVTNLERHFVELKLRKKHWVKTK
jgi:hypothetical protein